MDEAVYTLKGFFALYNCSDLDTSYTTDVHVLLVASNNEWLWELCEM